MKLTSRADAESVSSPPTLHREDRHRSEVGDGRSIRVHVAMAEDDTENRLCETVRIGRPSRTPAGPRTESKLSNINYDDSCTGYLRGKSYFAAEDLAAFGHRRI